MTDRNRDVLLDELLAKQAIAEQLAAYARGMDRIDLDLARSVFHPEATADYGAMFVGTAYAFVDFIGGVHPPMQTHSHHLGNLSVSVDGDRAGSECYVLVRLRSVARDRSLHDTISHGRYVDRWERRDGTWRITERTYLHAMDEVRPVAAAMFEPAGARDRADPSYDVLGHPGHLA